MIRSFVTIQNPVALFFGRYVIALFLNAMFMIAPGKCSAVDRLVIDSDFDDSYLPYYLDSAQARLLPPCTRQLNNMIHVVEPYMGGETQGLILRALNVSPDSDAKHRFSGYTYPDWGISEYPVSFMISDWELIHSQDSSSTSILATGFVDDSAFIYRRMLGEGPSNAIKTCILVRDTNKYPNPWKPSITLTTISDYDGDGLREVFVILNCMPRPRKLFCISLETMTIEWQLDVSSPTYKDRVFPISASNQSKLFILTSNPSNGAVDDNFTDSYAYLASVNGKGEVEKKYVMADDWELCPKICPGFTEGTFIVSHSLRPFNRGNDADSISRGYFISIVDSDLNILSSTEVHGNPAQLYILPFGEGATQHLWVRLKDRAVAVYDTALALVACCNKTDIGEIRSRIKIAGESDSVYVFSDGLYDVDFTKLMNVPFNLQSAESVELDTDGNTLDIVINGYGRYYIGQIRKRDMLDLAMVFYHNNQIYILMTMSGLLVGLVITSFYQRSTRNNLNQITSQKLEIERTHQELIETQQKLIEAEKYRQAKDIAGGFAHEIRNALFPADGLLTKLRRSRTKERESNERVPDYQRDVHKAISRAIDITELISDYTRLESSFQPRPAELTKVVREVIDDNRMRIEEQSVMVKVDTAGNLIVNINLKQFRIVVNNLLLNSLDALAERDDPRIDILMALSGNTVSIGFKDNGIGIEPENITRIFDTFFSTKPNKGTGLGLAMVSRIVEMYSGTIDVNSEPGIGTEFTIKLPLADRGRETTHD